ncbi:uncharacterized protein LOC107273518 [Cephus cinctus]|uniref:Uncharacterized protein LOC107273518 n=1 Tax=Cephus cinctus TaxID=211228 RepID=A0AAJ7CCJ4_CEPCN|nr:uncharacterized protein LOC107273518 [Cephus cinctus]
MESAEEENNCQGGKLKKYKVEAFIIPSIVIETVKDETAVNCTVESNVNEIDDVKIANRSKVDEREFQEEEDETSATGKSNEMLIITKVLAVKNVPSVQAASHEQETLEGVSENSNDIKCELHNESLTDASVGSRSNEAELEEIYEEIDEPIYAVPYVEKSKNSREPVDTLFKRPDFLTGNCRAMSKSFDNLQIPKPPKRTSSLKSIDERGEIHEENYREFCYHAMKNGYQIATQSPQEVSEEVFKENWLQRLESLRQREAFLRDKEVALQDRERLLFKKEKELRILERLVKEKVQKADLYLKRSRYLQSVESLPNSESERNLECRSSEDSKEFIRKIVKDVVSEKNDCDTQFSNVLLPGEYDIVPWCGKLENQSADKCARATKAQYERKIFQNSSDDKRNVESRISSSCSSDSKSSKNSRGSGSCKLSRDSSMDNNDSAQKSCHSKMSEHLEKCRMIQQSKMKISSSSTGTEMNDFETRVLKNPPNSRSSLTTSNTNSIDINSHSSNGTYENPISRFSGYSSFKSRPRPKISYDDLDSTLSADIGDASFAITSKKFDPEIFKRPYVFTRSASERYIRNDRRKGVSNFPNFCMAEKRPYVDIEEEKVLKKVSENILVSQNEDTKFQNYGLIDKNINTNNLKIQQTNKTDNGSTNDRKYSYLNLETGDKVSQCKNERSTKDRPISWNAEASEWLQKKRQAYNMATKRMATEDLENKENFGSIVKIEKSDKSLKKRESKGRKFTIFP